MEKSKKSLSASDVAIRIGIISILLNIFLAIGKGVVGNLLNYQSITSDAIHGFSDVLTTVIAIFAIKISSRKTDDKYNYGYERYSSIFSVILAVILAVLAINIGVEAIEELIHNTKEKIQIDALFWVTLGILIASILTKGVMFFLTRHGARIAKSDAMLADAWHQLIDALSSIGAIGGLIGGLYGVFFLDSVFTILIVLMILKVAFDIGKKGINELTDHAVSNEELIALKKDIDEILNGDRIVKISSRIYADKYYLELTIKTLKDSTVKQCYDEAKNLKAELINRHPDLKDVHIDYLPEA